jgi:hypothetical protein
MTMEERDRDRNDRFRRLMEVDRGALPPDGGISFNRLIFASSPYLLQHADNPVDWYPWGDEAFAKAKREDKPVFLSIGYSTCHWCHVMEEESFENPSVAEVLNRFFVAIKVDREERPDIDEQYMTVAQMISGSGGWPLNIIMTPDRWPFFAATYLPIEPRMGMPGIIRLLEKLADIWRTERGKVEANCAVLMAELKKIVRPASGALPSDEIFQDAMKELAAMFDPEWGGFGRAPKFPIPHNLMFLLRYWKRSGSAFPLAITEQTLRMMRSGGIFDQLGYGIHRYATDRQWLIPHFEKMLYDQALVATAYLETFQATGAFFYRQTAEEIFSYVLREMTSPEGGFYTGQDADSEGEEGRYYIWTEAEIRKILGEQDAAVACRLYGVTEQGNFEGRNILHLAQPAEELAAREGISPGLLQDKLARWRVLLHETQMMRIRPFRDEKVLTAWNGLMIAALSKGFAVTGEKRFLEAAEGGARFIRERLQSPGGRLLRSFNRGEGCVPAFLEDYAFYVHGLIGLYEATLDRDWLAEALRLSADMLRLFGDKEGGLYDSGYDAEEVLIRKKSAVDVVTPSGNSMATMNLLRLGRITGDGSLVGAGERILRAFLGNVAQQPAGYLYFLVALDYFKSPQVEITLAGKHDDSEIIAMLRAVGRRFVPHLVLRSAEEGEEPRTPGGKAAVWLCAGGMCRPPLADAQALGNILDEAL